MPDQLNVALICGPMYDRLYDRLTIFSESERVQLRIGFRGDHASLNQHLASLDHSSYDLVSSHTKYAPSQLHLLSPLNDVISGEEMTDFTEGALELAKINGHLYGLPRNIDVRLLHYRTDLLLEPPATWDELLTVAREINRLQPDLYGFIFPGKGSGLFGTFFELSQMGGAQLFPPGGAPDLLNEGGRWALGLLRTLFAEHLVPPEIVDWSYDEVHLCFRSGRAAMVADWPGFYGIYKDAAQSRVADRFALAPYPAGPTGKMFSYAGSHTFALTKRGRGKPEAASLLRFLVHPEQQLFEAQAGSVPVRHSVMASLQQGASPCDRARCRLLEMVIRDHLLVPPKFSEYPEAEEVLWCAVQKAMTGVLAIDDALQLVSDQIAAIIRRSNGN